MLFTRSPAKAASEERTIGDQRAPRRRMTPAVDIWEQDDALVVTADLPGCDQASVEITLEKGVLSLRGTPAPDTHEGFTLVYGEYEPGEYARTFTLPDEIDRDGVRAVVKNGVLTLTLPKAKAVLPRRIAVQAG